MKNFVGKFFWFLITQIGYDPRLTIRSIIGLPRYLKTLFLFLRQNKEKLTLMPCLNDWNAEGGQVCTEYFCQDLYVAQKIFRANPTLHVDIGSRIDGFVAHLASFRSVEVFDIRPLSLNIAGIEFRQLDLMDPGNIPENYCDSISCLHALEHFGLGRYGDPINVFGHIAGLKTIAHLLKPQGLFYLSLPIGRERIEFNSHRVFDPSTIVSLGEKNNLKLKEFSWITPKGILKKNINITLLPELGNHDYNLGVFIFEKP